MMIDIILLDMTRWLKEVLREEDRKSKKKVNRSPDPIRLIRMDQG